MNRILKSVGAKRRILIVEDERINREILGNMLMEEYDVEYAENGQQALDKLKDEGDSFSLILLDLMMPVLSGEEVLKFCRNDIRLIRDIDSSIENRDFIVYFQPKYDITGDRPHIPTVRHVSSRSLTI